MKILNHIYKEKCWGKTENGEFMTDGYTFRGKQMFGKAVEGIKSELRKGAESNFADVKTKAFDVLNNGNETEVSLEVAGDSYRGVAIVKLYAQSKKKSNVIMVTKCKESEHKFVTIVAEKVIKPLIERFLEGCDQRFEKESISKDAHFKCNICDKTFPTSSGMKCHKTKIHKSIEDNKEVEEMLVDTSLLQHETNKVKGGACELCGDEKIAKHDLKRHKRDQHAWFTRSISPPLKKMKGHGGDVNVKKRDLDDMDIDEESIVNMKNKNEDDFVIPATGLSKKIGEIPQNIKHLVGANDVVYKVKGDGACAPNAICAWLFHDETLGPIFKRDMNLQFADLWEPKYKNKTSCTDEGPFVRKLMERRSFFTTLKNC